MNLLFFLLQLEEIKVTFIKNLIFALFYSLFVIIFYSPVNRNYWTLTPRQAGKIKRSLSTTTQSIFFAETEIQP